MEAGERSTAKKREEPEEWSQEASAERRDEGSERKDRKENLNPQNGQTNDPKPDTLQKDLIHKPDTKQNPKEPKKRMERPEEERKRPKEKELEEEEEQQG